ncbi:MAG: hypothetical protein OXH92_12380 [Bryobacterales bacterium]|nr:hypothetical protein [Bryobacterales bacterium]
MINTRRISPPWLSDAAQADAPAAAASALFLKKDLRCIGIRHGPGDSKDILQSLPRQPKCTPLSGAASSGKIGKLRTDGTPMYTRGAPALDAAVSSTQASNNLLRHLSNMAVAATNINKPSKHPPVKRAKPLSS